MATAFTAPSDPVSDLLRLPFSRRSFGEKTDLISRGRPTPKLDGLTQAGKGFVRHFTECNYSRYDWLTASTVQNNLFYSPSLLFSISEGTWNSAGFSSLNSFTKAALKHQAMGDG
jgi:hypothetical protein